MHAYVCTVYTTINQLYKRLCVYGHVLLSSLQTTYSYDLRPHLQAPGSRKRSSHEAPNDSYDLDDDNHDALAFRMAFQR